MYKQTTNQRSGARTYDFVTLRVQIFSHHISDAKIAWDVIYAELVFEMTVAP